MFLVFDFFFHFFVSRRLCMSSQPSATFAISKTIALGLELSLERLISMKKDVFGLGSAQLAVTTLGLGCLAPLVVPGCTAASAFVIGIALALSSSAFVLQILKDKEDMSTRHGRAAFGILLLQVLVAMYLYVRVLIRFFLGLLKFLHEKRIFL